MANGTLSVRDLVMLTKVDMVWLSFVFVRLSIIPETGDPRDGVGADHYHYDAGFGYACEQTAILHLQHRVDRGFVRVPF